MRSRSFALVSFAAALLVWSAVSAQVPDHLKCYRVKDPATRTKYVADLDGLSPEPGCVIQVPARYLCTNTAKTNVQPTPPGGGPGGVPAGTFLCYRLRCPKTANPTMPIVDQFGGRTVVPTAPRILCAPAGAPTTSTTVTTSTSTTSSTMSVCGVPDATGFCGGPCPAGGTCAAIDATTCGCTNTLCDLTSSTPTCGGSCPRVTDTCFSTGLPHEPFCACVTFCGFQDGLGCPNDTVCPPGLTCYPGIGPACVCN